VHWSNQSKLVPAQIVSTDRAEATMTGLGDSPDQDEPGLDGPTLDGWGDEDPDEIQAYFEFAGYDDWEIDQLNRRREEEEEEEGDGASPREGMWAEGDDSETSGSRTGEFWSREDDEIVLYFWKGKSAEEIATRLQRTPRAVRFRVYFLSVEVKEINVGHREGCRHGKFSQDTLNRIEALYLGIPENKAFLIGEHVANAIDFVVDTLNEPLCGLTVAKTLAAAGHIPPVDLEHVTYYSPEGGQGNYKKGRWTVQEVAELKDAFNRNIPLEQILEVVDRSPLAIIWQLTSLGLLTNEDLGSILIQKYESTASDGWGD